MLNKSVNKQQLEKKAEIKREITYSGHVITVAQDKVTYPGSPQKSYDVVLHPGGMTMVPVKEDKTLVLVKQWRRVTGEILIELPAGTLEKGEDPLAGAQRELQEEIGYRADSITLMAGMYMAPGYCNEYLHFYLAKNLVHDPLVGDDSDEIDVIGVSLEEAEEMILRGEIKDAKTVAGLYLYRKGLKN